jgi:hypothetical protein
VKLTRRLRGRRLPHPIHLHLGGSWAACNAASNSLGPSVHTTLGARGTEPRTRKRSLSQTRRPVSVGSGSVIADRHSGMIAHGVHHVAQPDHPQPAGDEHAASANRPALQALGTRSNDRLSPGWWVEPKFRYMFCYRTRRTIPMSGNTIWNHAQPRVCRPCVIVFEKHGFQRGRITLRPRRACLGAASNPPRSSAALRSPRNISTRLVPADSHHSFRLSVVSSAIRRF